MSLPASFWSKVRKTDYCWLFQGAQNSTGYGCYAVEGVSTLAHRLAWEDVHGPIPADMVPDHLCRVRCCVNPEHIELVSEAENNRRARRVTGLEVGDECRNGHLIADESLLYTKPSNRATECMECRREAKRQQRGRGAGNAPLRRRTNPMTVEGSNAAIREWAQANDYAISDRGRIPSDIRRAYSAAHSDGLAAA